MAFNTLGPRGRYEYTSDTGQTYTIETDVDLATAAGLPTAGSPEAPPPPRGFSPRVVFVQATVNGRIARKNLVVNADSPLFTDSRQAVTIDGTAGTTTGRKGESLSY